MATKLAIYNLAFAHLGEPIVASLSDDPVAPNVAKANAQWAQALEVALVKAPWLCGLERHTLSQDVEPVGGWQDWKYPYRFTCPKGTLKVWSVNGVCDDLAWQRGAAVDAAGAAVMTINAEWAGPLKVELQVLRPPEALTPLLVDALGLLLASRLAGPILKDDQRATRLLNQANDAFVLAEGAEAGEIGGQEPVIGQGALARARRSAL